MEQSRFFFNWIIIQLEYHKDELVSFSLFFKAFLCPTDIVWALEFFVIHFPILANVYKG